MFSVITGYNTFGKSIMSWSFCHVSVLLQHGAHINCTDEVISKLHWNTNFVVDDLRRFFLFIYSAKIVKGHTPSKTMHFRIQQKAWVYTDIGFVDWIKFYWWASPVWIASCAMFFFPKHNKQLGMKYHST